PGNEKPDQEVPERQPIPALEVGIRASALSRCDGRDIRGGCGIRIEVCRSRGGRRAVRSEGGLPGAKERDERKDDDRQRGFADHQFHSSFQWQLICRTRCYPSWG